MTLHYTTLANESASDGARGLSVLTKKKLQIALQRAGKILYVCEGEVFFFFFFFGVCPFLHVLEFLLVSLIRKDSYEHG